MIAKVRRQEFDVVQDLFTELLKLYDRGEEEKMVMHMKRMVPEYKSNNSVFEKFDNLNSTNNTKKINGHPAVVVTSSPTLN